MTRDRKILLGIAVVVLLGGSFLSGMVIGANIAYENGFIDGENKGNEIVSYSGKDIWKEINAYRLEQGVQTLTLSEVACNNIAGRLDMPKKGQNLTHDGYEAFLEAQKEKGAWPADFAPTELIAGGPTASATVESLKTSPSHNLFLTNKEYTHGCAYARENMTVIFLHS